MFLKFPLNLPDNEVNKSIPFKAGIKKSQVGEAYF